MHCPPEKAAEIAALQKQYGITCCSCGTYFRLGVTPMEELPAYIAAAKALGTDILRLWCGNKDSGEYTKKEKAALFAACKQAATIAGDSGVTDPEPPVAESEFYSLPNCVLTPHIAGGSGNEVRRLGDCVQAEYQAFTTGKPCRYEVTLEMLQKMA